MSRTINKILIVDDERDICYLLKSVLQKQTNAKIDIATSVSEAQKRLNNSNYELTILDMQLGDGTGAELITQIKCQKHQNPYIVVISAYTSTKDIEQIIKMDVNEFIAKPLSREKIVNCYLAATA